MNNINSLNPTTSILARYFNGKCSKEYSFDTSEDIGKELNIITAGYSRVIDKPTSFYQLFRFLH